MAGCYYSIFTIQMNRVLEEDINSFSLPDEFVNQLSKSKIAVTGATGLIGSIFVKCLLSLNIEIEFTLIVRNKGKADSIFGDWNERINIVETDICDYFNKADICFDYILHCASPTNGKFMSDHPSETFLLAIESTKSILNYAKRMRPKGILYVSSIEYYGENHSDNPIKENMMGFIDHKSTRSSYALGKQGAEFLTFCYSKEFNIHVMTARLTQTFGAGISKEDNRVFSQFGRSIINGENIVLHTPGRSAKTYCYTIDCVRGLVYILLCGQSGEAYNVSNSDTYINVYDLANLYKDIFNPQLKVIIDESKNDGYAPETQINMNSDKLMSLGWKPQYNLKQMLYKLIGYLRDI